MVNVFENNDPRPATSTSKISVTVGVTQRAGPASAPPVEILSQLVQSYTQESPDNPLAAFLPELVRLAKEGSTDTSDLDGFENAWRLAAGDPVFRDLQDDLVDQLYYEPAVALAGKTGVRTPLGIVIMYDSAIQHGLGTDPDGLPAIIAKTAGIAGGTPATGPHEVEWLRTFLSVRSEVLQRSGQHRNRGGMASIGGPSGRAPRSTR